MYDNGGEWGKEEERPFLILSKFKMCGLQYLARQNAGNLCPQKLPEVEKHSARNRQKGENELCSMHEQRSDMSGENLLVWVRL